MSAHLSTPIPPPLSWTSISDVCPTCKVVHSEATCPKFWAAYEQFNRELARRLADIKTPLPPKPPACECGKPKRAFALTCDACAGRGRR